MLCVYEWLQLEHVSSNGQLAPIAHERGPADLVYVQYRITVIVRYKGFLQLLVAVAGLHMLHYRV